LGLEDFWQQRLPEGRETVSWEKVLRLLVNRWIEPGSEFRVHRHWFLDSAMDELLGVDFAWRKRTGSIVAWTDCWSTSKICLYG